MHMLSNKKKVTNSGHIRDEKEAERGRKKTSTMKLQVMQVSFVTAFVCRRILMRSGFENVQDKVSLIISKRERCRVKDVGQMESEKRDVVSSMP